MTYRVTILPDAELELEEVADFIAQDNPRRAISFVDEIAEYFQSTLSILPESGIVHSGQIRKLSFRKYTAFYVVDDDKKEVVILHIVDLAKPLSSRGIEL